MGVLLGLPASIALYLMAEPLIATIFHHGEMSAADVSMTALALRAFSIGVAAPGAGQGSGTRFFRPPGYAHAVANGGGGGCGQCGAQSVDVPLVWARRVGVGPPPCRHGFTAGCCGAAPLPAVISTPGARCAPACASCWRRFAWASLSPPLCRVKHTGWAASAFDRVAWLLALVVLGGIVYGLGAGVGRIARSRNQASGIALAASTQRATFAKVAKIIHE